MAQQPSGFTKAYTDPSGLELPNAWFQIQSILYSPYEYILIQYQIYKDEASYETHMSPIFDNLRAKIEVDSTDWNDYFDPDIMDVSGHNIQKQVISWMESNISLLKR